MKNFLLDTHILLWWTSNNPKLSKEAETLIKNPRNTFFVSTVSIWEIAIKSSLGKLKIPDRFLSGIKDSSFLELNITHEHAFAVKNLPNIHKDPFDRMLAVQSKIEGLTLLTSDKIFAKYKIKPLIV